MRLFDSCGFRLGVGDFQLVRSQARVAVYHPKSSSPTMMLRCSFVMDCRPAVGFNKTLDT
ncbi:MAG TPA: hypothetical protein VH817_21670 [Thermoleophilaceae bacterium]